MMTNAQAALIAAATLHSGQGRVASSATQGTAEIMHKWLDEQEAAQEATSALEVADDTVHCSTCARAITPSQESAGKWRDATGMWGNLTHDHRP